MRLLLDAHVSGPRIAVPLREDGHDVIAVSERPELEGATDVALLRLAAEQGRILITFDVKDFPGIMRDHAEAGLRHAGCIIVVGIGHHEFGLILRRLREVLARSPEHAVWHDLPMFVGRP